MKEATFLKNDGCYLEEEFVTEKENICLRKRKVSRENRLKSRHMTFPPRSGANLATASTTSLLPSNTCSCFSDIFGGLYTKKSII